jgi:hypothetical protein
MERNRTIKDDLEDDLNEIKDSHGLTQEDWKQYYNTGSMQGYLFQCLHVASIDSQWMSTKKTLWIARKKKRNKKTAKPGAFLKVKSGQT